jgi:hypothetical protein
MATRHDPALEAERFRPALAQLLATRQKTDVDLGTRRSVAKLALDCREAIKWYTRNPQHFPEVAEWYSCIKVYRGEAGITLHLIGWHKGNPYNTNVLSPRPPGQPSVPRSPVAS